MSNSAYALDEGVPTPLYLQLADQIRGRIAEGRMRVGDALPSERELSQTSGISRVTVRKAIETLLREGLLSRRHGSGTYIAPRIEQSGALLAGFTADMRRRGLIPGALWLERERGRATMDEARLLGLPPGGEVSRFTRVRTADGEPLAIERATIAAALLPEPQDVRDSLYETLIARGHRPVRGTQRLQASLATPSEARLLSIPSGGAILRIERLSFLADGAPVEVTRSAYRGDRYDFLTELRERGDP